MDLTPSLRKKALDSLDYNDSTYFNEKVKEVVKYRLLKEWLRNLSSSAENYRRISRLYLRMNLNPYPSTQHILSNFSDSLFKASSHEIQDDDLSK
jgi:hypothetical protein